MFLSFAGCSLLTGELIINASKAGFCEGCLSGVATKQGTHLIVSRTCPDINRILETITKGCNVLKKIKITVIFHRDFYCLWILNKTYNIYQ